MLIDRNLCECKSLQNMFDSVLLEFEQKLAVALFASLDSTYGHIIMDHLLWTKPWKIFHQIACSKVRNTFSQALTFL